MKVGYRMVARLVVGLALSTLLLSDVSAAFDVTCDKPVLRADPAPSGRGKPPAFVCTLWSRRESSLTVPDEKCQVMQRSCRRNSIEFHQDRLQRVHTLDTIPALDRVFTGIFTGLGVGHCFDE